MARGLPYITGPRAISLPASLSALAFRDYRLLWAGTATTQTGQWMQQVAIGWLVLEMTGSGFYLGLANFLRSIPQLFLSIPGGVLADRMDRRKLLVVSQFASAALTLAFAILVISGYATIVSILVLTFVIGSAMAMIWPVRQTLIPSTVPREALSSAVALNSVGLNLTRTLGPAMAGVVIALIGLPLCFFLQSIGLFYSFWASLALKLPPREIPATRAGPMADLAEGWSYIKRTPTVSGLLLTALVPTCLGMPYIAILPMFARDLEIGASGLGVLMTVLGVGSIVGSVVFTAAGDFKRKGRVMLLAAAAFGLALLGLAASDGLTFALLSLFAAGVASSVYQATNNTLLQVIVPDALRGRVISAYNLTWGMMPLGTLPLGWIADLAGAPFAVGIAGGLVVLFSAVVSLRLPQMRSL